MSQTYLPEQEQEVVVLVAEGLRDEEIGSRLGISPAEVRRAVSSACDRLGATDRLDLVILAFHFGIITLL
jgi:DNA-binding NarL/FixJ family response regulator